MPAGTSGWQEAGRGGGLFAKNTYSAVAELLGIALALLGKLDDCLGDHCRQRVSAINQSKPGQCGLESRGQVGNVFWTKRMVVFEDRPDRHVQPHNHTPHVRGNTFYIGSVCDGRRTGYDKSNWDRRLGITDSTVQGNKAKTPPSGRGGVLGPAATPGEETRLRVWPFQFACASQVPSARANLFNGGPETPCRGCAALRRSIRKQSLRAPGDRRCGSDRGGSG